MFDIKFKNITHHALNLLYSWITKLYNFSAINANNMIMLLVAVGFFELSHVLTKLMLGNQIAGY